MATTRREWGSLLRRPSGKYYLSFRDANGRRCMRLAGTSLRQAERFLRTTRRRVEAERRGEAVRQMTVADWWDDEYLDVLASRLKPSGLRTAQVHMQRLCDWLYDERGERGEIHIRDVTRRDAEDFVAYLIAQKLQPSYVRRLTSTIRRAWGDAITRNLAFDNPWGKLKIAAPRPTEVPWITPEQLTAIYDALPSGPRPHLVLVGETGLRVGEAQALRWRDVDVAGDAPRVTVRDGKTLAARRTIPLTSRATAILRERREEAHDEGRAGEQDLVLPPRSQQGLRVALTKACARATCERLKVHGLRHVYASHLVQEGVPAPTVARLLGHADGGALVMRLYGRWMPHDAESRAVAALDARRRDPRPPPPTPASEDGSRP